MAFLADRYAGRVEAYEVWNEPNHPAAWPSGPDAGQYARMLRAVAPVDPRRRSRRRRSSSAASRRNDYEYLEGAYEEMPDIGDYFDVMATHPYVYYGRPRRRVARRRRQDRQGRLLRLPRGARDDGVARRHEADLVHRVRLEHDHAARRRGVSWETQADYLARAYRCLEQDPYVEVATWYSLRNRVRRRHLGGTAGPDDEELHAKPAYDALKNYVPGAGGCTYSSSPSRSLSRLRNRRPPRADRRAGADR